MRSAIVCICLCVAASALVASQTARHRHHRRDAHRRQRRRADHRRVIVIADGRITAAGPRSSTPVPAGATIIDGAGKFVVPGLIDTNVHLSLYGGTGDRYETLAKYHPRQKEIVLEAAQLQLKHGVTTVRDSYGLLSRSSPCASGSARRCDRSAHPRRRQHRRVGRSVFGQLQPHPRAGPDAVPGAGQRRDLPGRRRGSRRHESRGIARRHSRLSRQGAGLHQVRRHARTLRVRRSSVSRPRRRR